MELLMKNTPPVGEYEDSNPRFHMATGAGYNDFHPKLSKEAMDKIARYRKKSVRMWYNENEI